MGNKDGVLVNNFLNVGEDVIIAVSPNKNQKLIFKIKLKARFEKHISCKNFLLDRRHIADCQDGTMGFWHGENFV